MISEVLQLCISNGLWAVLFVFLFLYQIKTNANGELIFDINLDAGQYVFEITNPMTGEVKSQSVTVVKRIIRYVSGTSDYEIWYSKDTNITLSGYSDTD